MSDTALPFAPFPYIDDTGAVQDGLYVDADPKCRNCQTKSCRQLIVPPGKLSVQTSCEFGVETWIIKNGDKDLRLIGVARASSVGRKQAIERWLLRSQGLDQKISALATDIAEDRVAGLHDIKSLIGNVFASVQEAIEKSQGESFVDRINSSEDYLQSLWHICSLLERLFKIVDILVNPASATYGRVSQRDVYRVCQSIATAFVSKARLKGCIIDVVGPSSNKPMVWDSFEVIPYVLVDNAVKYGMIGKTIRILVEDGFGGRVKVAVRSWGQVVPENERFDIFNRGVRASNSTGNGRGLGLFVAQTVAREHGTEIRYQVEDDALNGYGWNVFCFDIPPSPAFRFHGV